MGTPPVFLYLSMAVARCSDRKRYPTLNRKHHAQGGGWNYGPGLCSGIAFGPVFSDPLFWHTVEEEKSMMKMLLSLRWTFNKYFQHYHEIAWVFSTKIISNVKWNLYLLLLSLLLTQCLKEWYARKNTKSIPMMRPGCYIISSLYLTSALLDTCTRHRLCQAIHAGP